MFCEWVKEYKQHVVDEAGIGSDLMSCIVAKKGGNWLTCYATLHDLLTATISVQILEPDSVTLIVEVYHVKGQALFSFPPGELAPRFAGGDPHVVESIAVITTARDELMLATAMNYRYIGKHVDWLEPEVRFGLPESEMEHSVNMAGNITVPDEVMTAVAPLDELTRMKFVAWNFTRGFPCEVCIMTDQPPPGFMVQAPSLN